MHTRNGFGHDELHNLMLGFALFFSVPDVTKQEMVSVMEEYVSSVTPQRLTEARKQLKRLRSGCSQARSMTAAETYAGVLQRHRPRQDHERRLAELEKEGFHHAVQHNPGPRVAVQDRAQTRSFPATEPAGTDRSVVN